MAKICDLHRVLGRLGTGTSHAVICTLVVLYSSLEPLQHTHQMTRRGFAWLVLSLALTSASSFVLRINSSPISIRAGSSVPAVREVEEQETAPLTVLQLNVSEDTEEIEHSGDDENESILRRPSSKKVLGALVATLWGSVLTAAKLNLLAGYTSDWMIARDFGVTVLCGVLGYAVVQSITWATTQEYLQPRDARKLIHTLSAPLYMLLWPLFSQAAGAKFFAATVPLINAARLYLSSKATDADDDAELSAAVSRSGDRAEAAGGPLIYVNIMSLAILWEWRSSAVAIVALSTMAAGDGLADLIGRRLGKNNPWPTSLTGSSNRKSVAGSAALVVASVITSTGLLQWLQYWGCLEMPLPLLPILLVKLTVVAAVAAFFELIPVADDNYTVPLTAAVLTQLLLT